MEEKLLVDFGMLDGHEEMPIVHYISGIAEFDEVLIGIPFSKSKFNHSMVLYDKSLIFYLIIDKQNTIEKKITRDDITEVRIEKNTKINIRQISNSSKALKSFGLGSSVAGGIIGMAGSALIDKLGTTKDKEVPGVIYSVLFRENNEEKIIEIGVQSEYNNEIEEKFNKVFDKTYSPDNETSSGCFIATAAMGSINHPDVIELRDFRDNWIKKRSWGQTFIDWYYFYGRKGAEVISKHYVYRKLSMLLIVKPLVLLKRIIF